MNIYTKDQPAARVRFAVGVILRGTPTTRDFDSCFEMGDGDRIAATVYARALKNPRLMAALPKYLDMDSARGAHARIHKGADSPKEANR